MFNASVQPDIERKSFRFVNEDKKEIDKWINDGKIYEGMPYKIVISDLGQSLTVFDGIVDLNDWKQVSEVECEVSVKDIHGLNHLESRVNGITFALLTSRGVISQADYYPIDYIVEKETDLIEMAILSLSIYMFYQQIYELTYQLSESVAMGAGITSSGISGAVGATTYFSLQLLAKAVYYAILIIQLKNLVTQLFGFFYSPVRTHLGISFLRAFQKIAEYLGYGFQTGIPNLDKYVYLPSNQNEKGNITIGTPNVSDFGYRVNEFFELSNKMFNTKTAIIDGVLHLRNVDDPFWDRQATYKILISEDSLKFRYNNSDLIGAYVIKTETDLSEVWTVKNIDGSVFGVKTYLSSYNDEKAILIKGYESIDIPLARGARKTDLNAIENTLKTLGAVVDILSKALLSNTNFSGLVKKRIGMLKVSSQYHGVAKVLYMSGRNLDMKNAQMTSAEYLFKTHHQRKSFTANNYRSQRKIYESIRVPFGFQNMLSLQKSNRAVFNDKTVEVTSLEWKADLSEAVITFEEPFIHSKRLIEIESR